VPELPDVEGFRRVLEDHAIGERIARVDVLDEGVVHGTSGAAFERRLAGLAITRTERRGKWLLAQTNGPTLLFHFGMTGSLAWSTKDASERFERVRFGIDGGHLAYLDQRKLRGVWLADGDAAIEKTIGRQGPDALRTTGAQLTQLVRGHRGAVKSVLMDQHVLAGLGNMSSDELLWRARVAPSRRANELADGELGALGRAMRSVLRASVRVGRIPTGRTWLTSQRGVRDPHCPRCHNSLRTSRIGGRTSLWCPTCQH
jgi:formamidopyrimidine-DNA glycosylase